MKVNSIKGYQSNFGYSQVQNQQVPQQNQEQKIVQQLPNFSTQPLAGLVSPQKPKTPLPYPTSLPPVGGLITPPPVPKVPLPTTPGPLGGLISPPPSTKLPTFPDLPIVTAGLISHPRDNKLKEHILKIKEEIAKIENGQ